jgi:hypothetical protein
LGSYSLFIYTLQTKFLGKGYTYNHF